MRLDHFIARKYAFTGNKAKQIIKAGLVSVRGSVVLKAGFEVTGEESIELKEDKSIAWVSRSAGKLDRFLEQLGMNNYELRIIDTYCLDVGSSTWWFTQILLGRWASHVDAVDVGTDQLDERIRNNSRVTSHEQTDIRDFEGRAHYDIIVCDASFISLIDIFPSIIVLTSNDTDIILLWKPQFEVGREHLRRTWVPKDEKLVIEKMKDWEEFVKSNNCEVLQKNKSSVIGEAGNEEWLYYVKKLS